MPARLLRCAWLAGLLLGCLAARAQAPAYAEADGPTLIVLAAPRVRDRYYRPVRRDILEFQVAFARQILGRDQVVILCDRPTMRELQRELPADILLAAPMRDIWTRDYFPVGPEAPVLFRYAAAAQDGRQTDADWVQAGFTRLARRLGFVYRRVPWILDGGNLVDNGRDRAIVTGRFLADNRLEPVVAAALLREQLGIAQVAIVPADPDDPLGHADGIAAFVSSDTVAVLRGEGEFQDAVLRALRAAFPDVAILELDTELDDDAFDPAYGSAAGLYVNAILTDRFIYVPVFGWATDAAALAAIRAATDREVVPVDAATVSRLGGSVRCLGAQMKGENARRLIEAAWR